MSIKAKGPEVDPETKARQEAAERRAEAGRIEETQQNLSQETRAVIRNFGRLAQFSGRPSLAGGSPGANRQFLSIAQSAARSGGTGSAGGRLQLR